MEFKCQFKFWKFWVLGVVNFEIWSFLGPCSLNFKNWDLFQKQFSPWTLDLVTKKIFFTFKKPNFQALWGPVLPLGTKYPNFLLPGLFSCKNLTNQGWCSWKPHNCGDHNNEQHSSDPYIFLRGFLLKLS